MWYLKVGVVAVLLLRNTHGLRRYALQAYAPLRPAMCSTAARSVRIRRAGDYCCSIKSLKSFSQMPSSLAASLIDNKFLLTKIIIVFLTPSK